MSAAVKGLQDRSFHSDKTSSYILPNDSPEHTRLELQHKGFVTILEGKLSRAPVSKPSQILDMGCGTGCMTHWLAESFPAATVTGLDLSPVPKLRAQPANVRYLQGNFLQQSSRDWVSEDGDRPVIEETGMYDLVFSRLLGAGITNWEGLIAKQVSLAKPGGWVECHELVLAVHNSDDQPIDIWQVFKAESGLNAYDERCGEKIEGWMLAAGLEKVEVEVARVPIGGDGQPTQELQDVGDFSLEDLLEVSEVAARRGMVGCAPEKVETLVQKVRSAFTQANGWYVKFYMVYGRKPE